MNDQKLAEEALHLAFRHIQDTLGVETGDGAAYWCEHQWWNNTVVKLRDYIKFEQQSNSDIYINPLNHEQTK